MGTRASSRLLLESEPMSASPTAALDRVVLVDPSNFTIPYDLALASAIRAEGRDVRLLGQASELSHSQPIHHGHFYSILTSGWGRRLPSGSVRWVKGICHGLDMFRLSRWLTAFDAGIVHFQWSPVPVIDRWAIGMLQRRIPVVFTLHDSNPYQGVENAVMRRGYGGLLQTFNAIIVHTRQAEQRVAAMGIHRAQIHRIPHGLLGDSRHMARRRVQASSRDRLVLLQFGKIKPYKGTDLLLKALTLVPKETLCRLDVRIVGKPYMDTGGIEQFIHANGLAGCVSLRFEFVTETEEERLFAEADAIVLPYRDIDASGVAMSAIARGVPVLATAIDGFRELFEEGGGARLVPPADAAALAKAIADWTSSPRQLDALAEAMWLRRAGIPSWDEIARRHITVYAEARARWISGHERGHHSGLAMRKTL